MMNEKRQSLTQRWKPWQVVLLFGILQSAITGFLFSATFLGLAYWALPWLILNSACGGYAAHAVARGV